MAIQDRSYLTAIPQLSDDIVEALQATGVLTAAQRRRADQLIIRAMKALRAHHDARTEASRQTTPWRSDCTLRVCGVVTRNAMKEDS